MEVEGGGSWETAASVFLAAGGEQASSQPVEHRSRPTEHRAGNVRAPQGTPHSTQTSHSFLYLSNPNFTMVNSALDLFWGGKTF